METKLNGVGYSDTEMLSLESPFAGAQLSAPVEGIGAGSQSPVATEWESPFSEALSFETTSESMVATELLMAELESEEFMGALEALADEAAARHLMSTTMWTSHGEAPALATSEAEAFIGGVGAEADRLLERLEAHFIGRTIETLTENEIDSVGSRFVAEAGVLSSATEQFLGGLLKKAGSIVKGVVNVAKKGIQAVGKFLPLGKLWNTLKGLVKPLLSRVLKAALGKLPPAVRPIAETLAKKLFGTGEASSAIPLVHELGESFDHQLAEALLAPSDTEADRLVFEAEAEALAETPDTVAALDAARARLANQLREATPGSVPRLELEEFIPVVLAALPLIKLGITVIGRQRVVGFLADRLADLIKGMIGEQAAKAISGPIVDVGLGLLTLEAETQPEGLGAEALVSTVEDTVRKVMELPAEALELGPVRDLELHEAFASAASRHLPRALLRAGLPMVDTVHGTGVWMMMPRSTRPCFRYKKFTETYPIVIQRPTARAITFPGGDTLELRLLDAGVSAWPVQGEVHLYEAIPGTQLGHLAAFEGEGSLPEALVATDEFEVLTPEIASMLIAEPGQGRAARPSSPTAAPDVAPGTRLFRLKVAGRRIRRTRRFEVRLDASGSVPTLRLHLYLGERESHQIAEAVAKGQPAAMLAGVKALLGPAFELALTARLQRHLSAKIPGPVAPARAKALARLVSEGALTALGAAVSGLAPKFVEAARDPRPGATLTFEFRFSDKAALIGGTPATPAVSVLAGRNHG